MRETPELWTYERQAAAEGGEVADEKLSEVEKVISRLVRS